MGQSLGAGREEREAALGGDLLRRLGELEADARRALARAERIASEAEQEPRVALEATRTALLARFWGSNPNANVGSCPSRPALPRAAPRPSRKVRRRCGLWK
jgi:hypothetical protein